MGYSKNVPNKCNHCKYYINKDILGVVHWDIVRKIHSKRKEVKINDC